MHSCMKKIGESGRNNDGNSFNNGYGYSSRNDGDANNNSEEYSDEDENSNSRYNENNGHDRYNNNHKSSRYGRKAIADKMHAQQNGNDWQQFQDQSFTNNYNNSGRQNKILDKTCIVQCFFQEMKLVYDYCMSRQSAIIINLFFSDGKRWPTGST